MLLQYFDLIAQTKDDIRVTINNQTNMRKLSQDYFGDPDFWTYILKYNNIKDLSGVQSGIQVIIPQKKVKELLALYESASKSIQDAVKVGAKILASELLEKSANEYSNALKSKKVLDFDSSREFLIEAIDQAKKAYRQTMEIREKTIDAIISYKEGTVQKMFPSILNWENADLYDNLKENDWARTLSFSLANITFNDLSQIKLYENSEAEIQRSRVDVLNNKTDTKVKLEKGNAYAILLNSPKKIFDLDIPGVRTKINSKYFWVEKNKANAKLANYNGEITLGVKDSSVVVRKDQGSVIPDGGYPSKPKNLIPAPVITYPEDFSAVTGNDINFNWENIPRVPDYSLEISTSKFFKIVGKSYKNITKNSFQISGLQPGVYYWHVCSVDSLGLPGPFSEIRSVIILMDNTKPFIDVIFPSNNFVTRKTNLTVTGKTNFGCKVLVNHSNVITNGLGNFKSNLILNKGENIIEIESINSTGNTSGIYRNVFVESDSEINIYDLHYGELTDDSKYYADGNFVNLNLTTTPLSRIEIKSFKSLQDRTAYSDTLGKCEFAIPLDYSGEKFLLTVNTPAGYNKKITFDINKMNDQLEIILDSSLSSFTSHREITIRGKALGAKELFINGIKIPLDRNNDFSSLQNLNSLKNIFTIKAVDYNGNTRLMEKKIICNDNPPKLISSEIRKIGDNLFELIVKAEDETDLKKSALAEINFTGGSTTVILTYNSISGFYELTFISKDKVKPQVKSVTLEDELNNKKTYLVQNKN